MNVKQHNECHSNLCKTLSQGYFTHNNFYTSTHYFKSTNGKSFFTNKVITVVNMSCTIRK